MYNRAVEHTPAKKLPPNVARLLRSCLALHSGVNYPDSDLLHAFIDHERGLTETPGLVGYSHKRYPDPGGRR